MHVLNQKIAHQTDHYVFLQVHLSDSDGMPILSQLLWVASYQQVESSEPEPEPEVRARPSPPVPRRSPRVVVTGEVTVPPHSNPFEWNVVGPGRKVMWHLLQLCG